LKGSPRILNFWRPHYETGQHHFIIKGGSVIELSREAEKFVYYRESDPDLIIMLGNCLDIMPLLPKVDLVVTDPPYGIFKRVDDGVMFGKETIYSIDKTASEWDKRPSPELLLMARDMGKYHVIWGGNYFADILGACKSPLIWNKKTGNNGYADGECAWSNVAGTMRIFTHQWCGAFKDSERGRRAVHPTQKPIQLMKWSINLKKDEVKSILDPFLGSGTTLVACKELGRAGIGIEISEKYCQIAKTRLINTQRMML